MRILNAQLTEKVYNMGFCAQVAPMVKLAPVNS